MDKLDVADHYVAARYDYGPFKHDVLGLGFHMTEGNGGYGDVDYLHRNPERGVSVHFVIINTGEIYQMLPIDHACGGLDPRDTSSPDKGYYGQNVLKAVLGERWYDPNSVSIQCEIGGKARFGPNAKQVAAAIKLGLALKTVNSPFLTLRGSFGHADQTDDKACPGLTAAMKAIFTGVGGHGLWSGELGLRLTLTNTTGHIKLPHGSDTIRVADGAHYSTLMDIESRYAVGAQLLPSGSTGYIIDARDNELHFVRGGTPGLEFTETQTASDALAAATDKLVAWESWYALGPSNRG